MWASTTTITTRRIATTITTAVACTTNVCDRNL
jgi:hypothetical protein